jgi:hypothetical protein
MFVVPAGSAPNRTLDYENSTGGVRPAVAHEWEHVDIILTSLLSQGLIAAIACTPTLAALQRRTRTTMELLETRPNLYRQYHISPASALNPSSLSTSRTF